MMRRLLGWLSDHVFSRGTETRKATGRIVRQASLHVSPGGGWLTDSERHAANYEQTDRLSDQDVRDLIASRTAEGKPVEKLISAARDRGIQLPTSSMSDAALSGAIKEREAHGHTGATDSTTHALNCAQTGRMSTGQIDSAIAARQAAGLPTGKLEAARRNRG